MGRTCSVVNCPNRHIKKGQKADGSIFKVDDSVKAVWSKILGCSFNDKDNFLCEKHFHSWDIKSEYHHKDPAGNVLFKVNHNFL